jgi:aryl-alcohol dehydrogenase-like predicted oxidoreductase
MSNETTQRMTRRQLIQSGACAGAAMAFAGSTLAATAGPTSSLITRAIPATGEKVPVMGVGTNAFREADYDTLRALLKRMSELGGSVIDTAPVYGESEGVIGRALAELKLRDKFFISTKFNAAGKGFGPSDNVSGRESFDRSLQRLRTRSVDLLEVHRLAGLDELMPLMQEYKQAGKIRYLGVTTYRNDEHEQMAAAMRAHTLDFIQIDYSLANRAAANTVFPLALEKKVAVMINVPLGGRSASLFKEVGARALPTWAAEFGASSWSQFFLKYVASHPAVTCVIPGSTSIAYLEDNQGAGHGKLPNAEQRKRMEQFWDTKA